MSSLNGKLALISPITALIYTRSATIISRRAVVVHRPYPISHGFRSMALRKHSGLTQFKMPAFSVMILFFTFTVLCLANCVVSCRRVLVYELVTASEIGWFSELVSVVDLFLYCVQNTESLLSMNNIEICLKLTRKNHIAKVSCCFLLESRHEHARRKRFTGCQSKKG